MFCGVERKAEIVARGKMKETGRGNEERVADRGLGM